MNVATITMDPAEAEAKLATYRKSLDRRKDAEYEQIAAAYAQLAKGTPLLSIPAVFAACPRDAKGRPMLALARADRKQVKYSRQLPAWGERLERFDTAFGQGRGAVARDAVCTVPMQSDAPEAMQKYVEGYAIVPLVPPEVRGARDLAQHFTLWEVEAWSDRAIGARADRDPYLLQRISVELYAVVGEWDLTDVERAIMQHRVDA